MNRRDGDENQTKSTHPIHKLIQAIEGERAQSRRAFFRKTGKVLLAGAAYEIATLGLTGCAAYRSIFKSDKGVAWNFSDLHDYQKDRWAGFKLGTTSIVDLTKLRYDGDIKHYPSLGRVELVSANPLVSKILP